MKRILGIGSILMIIFFMAGCGETVNGAMKDGQRIGSGVKKIFIRE